MIYKIIRTRTNDLSENEEAPTEYVLKWLNSQGGVDYHFFDSSSETEFTGKRATVKNSNLEPKNNIIETGQTTALFASNLTTDKFLSLSYLIGSPKVLRLSRNKNKEPMEISIENKKIPFLSSNLRHQITIIIKEKEPTIIQ